MPVPTSGLARLTIRAPRRRLDLAVPHQVPLAELLPEVLRRAGEADPDRSVVGGWMLRRGDGAALSGDAALARQGVRDGDVLYLVPRNLTWPEPAYDDVIEEIASSARAHARAWDAGATRLFALAAAAVVLLAGLALLVVTDAGGLVAVASLAASAVLLTAGGLLSRAGGDGVAGATAAGFGLLYAAVGAELLTGGAVPARVLVGASALLLAAAVGGVAVGFGVRVFVAGASVGLFGAVGGVLGLTVSPVGAAAIVAVALMAGIGLAPLLAVRLGKLPLPLVTAAAEVLAQERRPDRPDLLAAVARADEILFGVLLGIAVTGAGTVAVLATSPNAAARLLAGLVGLALLSRARLFPALAARLPLLLAGVSGLGLAFWSGLVDAGAGTRLVAVGVASAVVVVLLTIAATAQRRRPDGSPYLSRLVDLVDIIAVIALAPVACAVLNLYGWVGGLVG